MHIFLSGSHASSDMAFGLIHIQYLSGGLRKILVDTRETFGNVLMCGRYQMERCLTQLFCHFYLSLWHH